MQIAFYQFKFSMKNMNNYEISWKNGGRPRRTGHAAHGRARGVRAVPRRRVPVAVDPVLDAAVGVPEVPSPVTIFH